MRKGGRGPSEEGGRGLSEEGGRAGGRAGGREATSILATRQAVIVTGIRKL